MVDYVKQYVARFTEPRTRKQKITAGLLHPCKAVRHEVRRKKNAEIYEAFWRPYKQ